MVFGRRAGGRPQCLPVRNVAGLSGEPPLFRVPGARVILFVRLGPDGVALDRLGVALDQVAGVQGVPFAKRRIFDDRGQSHHRTIVVEPSEPRGLRRGGGGGRARRARLRGGTGGRRGADSAAGNAGGAIGRGTVADGGCRGGG